MALKVRPRPALGQIFVIEMSLCILIAAISVASTVGSFPIWIVKMHMLGGVGNTGPERLEAIEHFDLSGSFEAPPRSAAIVSPDPTSKVPDDTMGRPPLRDRRARFKMDNKGFTVSTNNSAGKPMSMDFAPRATSAEGYMVVWSCQSRNLPLDVVRQENSNNDQDPIAACRTTTP